MRTLNPVQEFTEEQAAESLGISLDALYRLLDGHIFNNGTTRPRGLLFTHSDLLLLSYWHNETGDKKIVRMPRRR
jgi:hypothetical protein